MSELIQIEQFLALSESTPVIDVRSPAEYNRGHIKGAVSIPLFTDRERKEVGTRYKQINKEAAMYAGLEFAGKKLVKLAKEGEKVAGKNKKLLVHCWRGGMRSKSMVWLFETMGIICYQLEGGYKSYRQHIRKELASPLNLHVLGGLTGSGKTEMLYQLSIMGEQVVDLEGLAHHKGSAFGALGESPQPTTEQFENNIYTRISTLNRDQVIWIEDESRNIGKCVIPDELFFQMKKCEIVFLEIPLEERARHLVKRYATFDQEELKSCIFKIEKKLGGDRTKAALKSIEEKDFMEAALITLKYYDKAYLFSLEKNHMKHVKFVSGTVDNRKNASMLQRHFRTGN